MDAEEALLSGHAPEVITALRQVEDFRPLVDHALDLQDYSTLWYIMEIGSRYDEDLDAYFLERCAATTSGMPCRLLEKRENPFVALEEALVNADDNLLLYAVDLLYTPLDPEEFNGYSSQEYARTLAQSRLINKEVEDLILEASPSFFDRVYPSLPKDLQVNLALRRLF